MRITDLQDNHVYTGVSNPKFAPISVSTSGDNTIVVAVAGFRVRVVRYSFKVAAAVNVTWKSSVAGALTGPLVCSAAGDGIAEREPAGIVQTAIGEALVLNLSGGVSVGGSVTYTLVPLGG